MLKISIHAPLQGATCKYMGFSQTKKISIHAPLQGATWNKNLLEHTFINFNPRSLAGSDLLPCFNKPKFNNFNPRSLAGSDTIILFRLMKKEQFQSTLPCRERHKKKNEGSNTHTISIHAPLQGATCWKRRKSCRWHISIHAPLQGATAILLFNLPDNKNFNPRSLAGSDT